MKTIFRNNKFLLCFRPVVDMDQLILESKPAVIDHGSRHSRSFKCFNSENKTSVPENVKKSDNSMMVRRSPNRTLSKVIKAVLFEAILAKRVRDRKSLTQDSYQSSKRRISRHAHKSLDSRGYYNEKIKVKSGPIFSSQSSVGSLSSSSSTSSCSTSTSISEPQKRNQNSKNHQERVVVSTKPSKQDNMAGPGTGTGTFWSFNCVITWLLIIILTVTCIWGRLHAIICTTICLYYLPRQSTCRRRPENEVKRLKKSESGEYKKKRRIIIEGLLERNHHKENALNT